MVISPPRSGEAIVITGIKGTRLATMCWLWVPWYGNGGPTFGSPYYCAFDD